MAKIYTRTGDDGTTGLFLGGRLSKADVLLEATGDVDETVALLGVARAACPPGAGELPEPGTPPGAGKPEPGTEPGAGALAELLLRLQRELFVLGADLATHPGRRDRLVDGVSRVTAAMVTALESEIDALVAARPLRPVFIVPGANPLSAALDHARTVTRRAERHALAARAAGHPVDEAVTRYLNRLSDLLFVLARGAAGEVQEPVSHE